MYVFLPVETARMLRRRRSHVHRRRQTGRTHTGIVQSRTDTQIQPSACRRKFKTGYNTGGRTACQTGTYWRMDRKTPQSRRVLHGRTRRDHHHAGRIATRHARISSVYDKAYRRQQPERTEKQTGRSRNTVDDILSDAADGTTGLQEYMPVGQGRDTSRQTVGNSALATDAQRTEKRTSRHDNRRDTPIL